MEHWISQPYTTTFQRSFFEKITYEVMRWSQEQESSGVTQSPNPPFIDRHTWLEEMHE